MLTKIDTWLFQRADALVLWLWNNWGVRHLSLARLGAGATLVTSAALVTHTAPSGWGGAFAKGIVLLLWVAFIWSQDAFLRYVPVERRNLLVLELRHRLASQLVRLIFATACVFYSFQGLWLLLAFQLAVLAYGIVLKTLEPTKPRRRKPRKVATPSFQLGLQPIPIRS